MVLGYHGTDGMGVSWDGGAFDMILCFLGTFIRTDGFGSLTENDVTGGAHLICSFGNLFMG